MEPKDRMTIANMLKHPWLEEDDEEVAQEEQIDLGGGFSKENEFTMLDRCDSDID